MTDRRNEDIWNDRAQKAGNAFTRHPWRWGLGILVALVVGVWALGFAGEWFGAGTKPFRAENVEKQFKAITTNWEKMTAAAENACGAAVSENSQTFTEDPALAYKASYRSILADYNARMENYFEAKNVAPSGYPRPGPTLEERLSELHGVPILELWTVCPSYTKPGNSTSTAP